MQRKAAIENRGGEAPAQSPGSPAVSLLLLNLLELRPKASTRERKTRPACPGSWGRESREAGSQLPGPETEPAIPAAGSRPRISGPFFLQMRKQRTLRGVLCLGADAPCPQPPCSGLCPTDHGLLLQCLQSDSTSGQKDTALNRRPTPVAHSLDQEHSARLGAAE